jgi:hypothetical protein
MKPASSRVACTPIRWKERPGTRASALLANILHYVLDLWVEQWKRRHATGQVRLVRYADDYLLLFQRRQDAETMTAALAERLAKFGLHLHEDKTRLIEFGRFAEENRRRKGKARPEVFDFLGFTHYCGRPETNVFSSARRPKEADDPQSEGAAPGDEAMDAPTAPRPAQATGCGAARALRLLRHPWQ